MKLLHLLALAAHFATGYDLERPVVGVLTLPHHCSGTDAETKDVDGNKVQDGHYVASSYVKWLEMSGLRVRPVLYDAATKDLDELKKTLGELNGFLLTGGGVDFDKTTPYWHSVKAVIDYTMENEDGFVLWGTCLGFEALLAIAGDQEYEWLESFEGHDVNLPIEYDTSYSSRMFASDEGKIVEDLFKSPISYNNHHQGVGMEKFNDSAWLNDYVPFATSVENGPDKKSFVALFEHKTKPIYGVQFHPEKVTFEWTRDEVILHSADAIRANNYLSHFFADEVRKAPMNYPETTEGDAKLIYAYTGGLEYSWQASQSNFTQIYEIECPTPESEIDLVMISLLIAGWAVAVLVTIWLCCVRKKQKYAKPLIDTESFTDI